MLTTKTNDLPYTCDTVLVSCYGDALGAGYEFAPPRAIFDAKSELIGGGLGNFAPGEWTDDSAQAMALVKAINTYGDLNQPEALDMICIQWMKWFNEGVKDIGIHTQHVFTSYNNQAQSSRAHERMRHAALDVFNRNTTAGGNGALMRSAPLLCQKEKTIGQVINDARIIAGLTHPQDYAIDASAMGVYLCAYVGLYQKLPPLAELLKLCSTKQSLRTYTTLSNGINDNSYKLAQKAGFAPTCIMDVYCALDTIKPKTAQDGYEVLDWIIAHGGDTDTTSCVAGAVLGAWFGRNVIPETDYPLIHGWPSWTLDDVADFLKNTVI